MRRLEGVSDMALVTKSEYLCGLSAETQDRYERKVAGTGLSVDLTRLESQNLSHAWPGVA